MVTQLEAPIYTKTKGKILIVEVEAALRDSLGKWFSSEGYQARSVASAGEALECIANNEYDVVLLDIKLQGIDGMELQFRLMDADPELTVIIMTAYASMETAVRALKQGAYDYIAKPIDPEELSHLLANALDHRRARREVVRLRENLREVLPSTELIGKAPAMKKVRELIEMAAATESTLLITGEIGTGKEVVARAAHATGARQNLPIATVHCGSLTDSMLESELFGYEKGAVAGAHCRKKGKFEEADGGTVFLDEISDISRKIQTDLLRVLETNEIVRVGGNRPVKVDFRCMAATYKDLYGLAKSGAFRPDLYYRLHVLCIDLPPLRDRREDIPLLAAHFLNKFCMMTSRTAPRISAEALRVLMHHEWPGNVRELENAVERALVVCHGAEINPADFSFPLHAGGTPAARTLDDLERMHIERVLRETDHNLSRSARILGIDRTTLYNKLKRYDLKKRN
jgi:two-component system response regulator HydG